MSTPASLISIEGGIVNIHLPGSGHDIEDVVIKGPESVTEYVFSKEGFCLESINGVWDQGGLLVDYDNSTVLMFSENEADWDEEANSAFMAKVKSSPLWKGWTVRWARKRLYDFACYVGQRDTFLKNRFGWLGDIRFTGEVFAESIGFRPGFSIVENGVAHYYPLELFTAIEYLAYGPEIIDMLFDKANGRRFDIGDFYSEGVIVNSDSKTIVIWSVATDVLPCDIEKRWPGWKVQDCQGDHQRFLGIFNALINAG